MTASIPSRRFCFQRIFLNLSNAIIVESVGIRCLLVQSLLSTRRVGHCPADRMQTITADYLDLVVVPGRIMTRALGTL